MNGGFRRQGTQCDLRLLRIGLGGLPSHPQVNKRKGSEYRELHGRAQVINLKAIAPPLAEAELYVATNALSETIGSNSLGQDFLPGPSHSCMDAQTTLGLRHRAALVTCATLDTGRFRASRARARQDRRLAQSSGCGHQTSDSQASEEAFYLGALRCQVVPSDAHPEGGDCLCGQAYSCACPWHSRSSILFNSAHARRGRNVRGERSGNIRVCREYCYQNVCVCPHE